MMRHQKCLTKIMFYVGQEFAVACLNGSSVLAVVIVIAVF